MNPHDDYGRHSANNDYPNTRKAGVWIVILCILACVVFLANAYSPKHNSHQATEATNGK